MFLEDIFISMGLFVMERPCEIMELVEKLKHQFAGSPKSIQGLMKFTMNCHRDDSFPISQVLESTKWPHSVQVLYEGTQFLGYEEERVLEAYLLLGWMPEFIACHKINYRHIGTGENWAKMYYYVVWPIETTTYKDLVERIPDEEFAMQKGLESPPETDEGYEALPFLQDEDFITRKHNLRNREACAREGSPLLGLCL